jgi:hypothetical protein
MTRLQYVLTIEVDPHLPLDPHAVARSVIERIPVGAGYGYAIECKEIHDEAAAQADRDAAERRAIESVALGNGWVRRTWNGSSVTYGKDDTDYTVTVTYSRQGRLLISLFNGVPLTPTSQRSLLGIAVALLETF